MLPPATAEKWCRSAVGRPAPCTSPHTAGSSRCGTRADTCRIHVAPPCGGSREPGRTREVPGGCYSRLEVSARSKPVAADRGIGGAGRRVAPNAQGDTVNGHLAPQSPASRGLRLTTPAAGRSSPTSRNELESIPIRRHEDITPGRADLHLQKAEGPIPMVNLCNNHCALNLGPNETG